MTPACPGCGAPAPRIRRIFRSTTFPGRTEWEQRACAACGLYFVHPQPSVAEVAALYASPRYYELTDTERVLPDGLRERPESKIWEYDRILKRLARHGLAHGALLDVGCGWGLFMERAVKAGWTAAGLDPSHAAASYVREKLGLPCTTDPLSGVRPGSAGLVAMMDVLEHVHEPLAFLREARAALSADGGLVLRVPFTGGFTNELVPRVWDAVRRRPEDVFLQHLSDFTPRSLRALVERAGFRVLEIRGLENPKRYARKRPVRRLVWTALSALGTALGRPSSLIAIARRTA